MRGSKPPGRSAARGHVSYYHAKQHAGHDSRLKIGSSGILLFSESEMSAAKVHIQLKLFFDPYTYTWDPSSLMLLDFMYRLVRFLCAPKPPLPQAPASQVSMQPGMSERSRVLVPASAVARFSKSS